MSHKSIHQKVQVWIVNRLESGDETLLFKVIPKRGGGWHPVTGSVEDDEAQAKDWLGAAKRETEEETGIAPSAGEWIDLKYTFEFEGRWGPARERSFALILSEFRGKVTLDPSEHEAMRWLPLERAGGELGFDSQRRAWEELTAQLRRLR